MIGTFALGVFTNFINGFNDRRKQKFETENLLKLKNGELEIEIRKKEYDLKIEQEKTNQAEIEMLKEEIKALSTQTQEIYKNEREIVSKASHWVVDLIALEKPVAVYCVVLSYVIITVGGAFGLVDVKNSEFLLKMNYTEIVEFVFGFLFGGVLQKVKNYKK